MRNFNSVVADFRKQTNPNLTAINSGTVRRWATPAIVRGIPGQKIASAPGTIGVDGYQLQSPKVQKISLAAAFTDQLYNLSGTVLWYLTSTNVTDSLLFRVGSLAADQLQWGPGNGLEGLPYSQLYITNLVPVPGATAQIVYFTDSPDKPVRFF